MEETRRREPRPKMYETEIINICRVTKVTKGGRHFRFSATVAVGDRKGQVGIGTGKANEVPDAIKKAVQAATKNVVRVSIVEDRTIPHEALGVRGASKVMLKPAAEGTGVIAGGAVRAVVETVGISDIRTKALRSNNPCNVVRATVAGLAALRSAEEVAAVRGKSVKEIVG